MRDAGLACGSDSRMLRDSCHSGGPPASLANRLFQRPAGQNTTSYLNITKRRTKKENNYLFLA